MANPYVQQLPLNMEPQGITNSVMIYKRDMLEQNYVSSIPKMETTHNSPNSSIRTVHSGNIDVGSVSIRPVTGSVKKELGEFTCRHCSVDQNTHDALEKHLKSCNANNNNTTQASTDSMQENDGCVGKPNHMCMECGEVLSNSYSLKRHSLIHSGNRPHKCEYCDKRYAHAYLLMHHLNTHAGDRPYRCSECGKDFTNPNTLRRHKGVHRKQQHQCQHCEQQFQRMDFLDKHLAKEHDVSKQHLCLVCGKSFTLEDMLQEHIESHSRSTEPSDKDLKCDLCENTFSRMSSLSRHKKQMHNCDMDGSSILEQSPYFSGENNSKRDEKENKKTPKKDTVVVCQLCGKSFSRADSLKRHTIGVHENSKNLN